MQILVNLDYESYLFDPNYHENATQFSDLIKNFEYVFFPFAKASDTLISHQIYSENDLNHYRNLGFNIPEIKERKKANKNMPIINWWGEKFNKDLEIKLNSKLTSVMIAQENDLGFWNGVLVYSNEDIFNHLQKNIKIEEWILKNPFGMSGKSHYLFSKKKIPPEHIVLSRPILEPLYKRILDFGTTFEVCDHKIKNIFTVINYNDHIGQFKGAGTIFDQKYFYDFFKVNYNLDFEKILEKLQLIANLYLEMGSQNNIQIDSFLYINSEGKVDLYPLVEVNCRKTMGLVCYELSRRHPKLWCDWKFLDDKKTFYHESFHLHPENSKIKSFVTYKNS